MNKRIGKGVSLTIHKLNLLVRSYLYRKKLSDTLETIQYELLAAIRESPSGIVFALGYAITADPHTGEINLKPTPKTDSRQLRFHFMKRERSLSPELPNQP